MKHLILTRFNLRIWNEDKHNRPTLTEKWLRERVALFENYCLPSLKAQTCQDFRWIILFGTDSPEWLLGKIDEWCDVFPQIRPVSVQPASQGVFRRVFREVAASEAEPQGGRMLTTYLDNDDALRCDFVEDVQRRASELPDGTFLCYRYGVQYFTDMKLATCVPCRYNHFPSYVEDYGSPDEVQTFFRLVSHAQMKVLPGSCVVHVENRDKPMWMEVVHETNKYNDVHMALRTRLMTAYPALRAAFGLPHLELSPRPRQDFVMRFVPRFFCQFFRHVKGKLFGVKRK